MTWDYERLARTIRSMTPELYVAASLRYLLKAESLENTDNLVAGQPAELRQRQVRVRM